MVIRLAVWPHLPALANPLELAVDRQELLMRGGQGGRGIARVLVLRQLLGVRLLARGRQPRSRYATLPYRYHAAAGEPAQDLVDLLGRSAGLRVDAGRGGQTFYPQGVHDQ